MDRYAGDGMSDTFLNGMLRRRRLACALCRVVLATALPGALGAQPPADAWLRAASSDSAAWQRVLTYVTSALSVELVASATDDRLQAWDVRLPVQDKQSPLLRRQLTVLLRAREVTPTDAAYRLLAFDSLVVAQDTARVVVRFDDVRRCRGSATTEGGGWATTVYVARHPQLRIWGAAVAPRVMAGDRAACKERAPGRIR